MGSWTRSWLAFTLTMAACSEGGSAPEVCGDDCTTRESEPVAARKLVSLTTPAAYLDTCGREVVPSVDPRPCVLAPWKDQFTVLEMAELKSQTPQSLTPDASSLQSVGGSAYFLSKPAGSANQLIALDLTAEAARVRATHPLWSGVGSYDHFELSEVRHGMIAAYAREPRASEAELIVLDAESTEERLRWEAGNSKVLSAVLMPGELWLTTFSNACHVLRVPLEGEAEDVTSKFVSADGRPLSSYQQCVLGESDGQLYVAAGRDHEPGQLLAYALDAQGNVTLQFAAELGLEIRGFGADRVSASAGLVVVRTSEGIDVVNTQGAHPVAHIALERPTSHALHDGLLYVGGYGGTIRVYDVAGDEPRYVHTLLGASTGLALSGGELVSADTQVLETIDLSLSDDMLRFDPVSGSAGRCTGTGDVVLCKQPAKKDGKVIVEPTRVVLYREAGEGYAPAGTSVTSGLSTPVTSEAATAALINGAIHVFDHATGTTHVVAAAPGEKISELRALDGPDLLYAYVCGAGQQCFRVLDLESGTRVDSLTVAPFSDLLLEAGQLFAADGGQQALLAYPEGELLPAAPLSSLPLALSATARPRLHRLGRGLLLAAGGASDFVVDVSDPEQMGILHTLPAWPASKNRQMVSGTDTQLLVVDGQGASARAYDLIDGLPFERLAAPYWVDGSLQLGRSARLRLLVNELGFYVSEQPLPAQ